MKNFFSRILPIFRRKQVYLPLIVAAIIIVIWVIVVSGGSATVAFTPVSRGTIISEVSVTGQVKASRSLDLSFEKSGMVTKIPTTVSASVKTGETLAVVSNADLYAQLAQAQAQVKAQQAKLDSLEQGARQEDIEVSQALVSQAQQTLTNAYGNVVNVLSDAYAKADDAVRNEASGLFININTSNPQITLSVTNSQVGDRTILASNTTEGMDAQNKLVLAVNALNNWLLDVRSLQQGTPSNTQLINALDTAGQHLIVVRSFLESVSFVLNEAVGTQTTIDAFKTAVNLGRTNVNTAATAVNTQKQTINSAQAALISAQNNLALKQAPATAQDIQMQEAQVEQAQAQVAYYQSQLSKTIISAPFDGVVTRVVNNVGDLVQANVPVISIIGSGPFQIETNITESDIAKIQAGQHAKVTLDAYGSDVVFAATVAYRDLAQTIIDGVATYKTVLQFDTPDDRILQGATANIDILAAQKDNALFVSSRDIIEDGGKKFVVVLTNEKKGTTDRVQITTGLRGSDGHTEVLSGISQGDKIVSE